MRHRLLSLAVFASLLSSTLLGQVSGTLTGSVQDPSGSGVGNADIELFLEGGSKAVLAAKSTAEGLFTISGVRPETYRVKVSATGFSASFLDGVRVEPARSLPLPAFKLQLGSVTTSVEVTGEVQGVQTVNTEVSSSVTLKQVASLPIINRSPLALVGTQAGVFSSGRSTTTINGQRSSFTTVSMNGINIQDNFIRTNGVDFLPNQLLLTQVAEFTVSTSNQDASQTAASSVSFVTPSGSNAFHGQAFWSNRNNYFAANTWFNNLNGVKRPFLNQNQLGGVFSGHLIKDKLFFYGAYEAVRTRQQSTFSSTILTSDARNGIFTYRDTAGVTQKVNLLTLTGNSINPAIAPILAAVPTADKINNLNVGDGRNTGGYNFLIRNNDTRDNVTLTSDYIISSRQQLSGSFNWNRQITDRTDLQNDYSLIPKVANDQAVKFLSLAWRITPTATLTNELRGGMNLAPAVFATNEKFPTAIITGFSFNNPLNTFRAQGRDTNTYALNDNATWVRGRHLIKFGFAYQSIRTAPYNDAGITPTYTVGIGAGQTGLVTSQLPGVSAADLNVANLLYASLTGRINTAAQTFNITSQNSGYVNGATALRSLTFDNYAGYIQDNWRVRPNLTLEFGLRYEFYVPLREKNNLFLEAQIPNGDVRAALLNPLTSFDFTKGGMFKADKMNFGPRVGFAWNVFGSSKTSIRGGFGMYYVNDQVVTSVRNSLTTNAGLSSGATVQGSRDFANSLTPLPVPGYKVPRNGADNYNIDTAGAFGITNPGLKTPYTSQYSLSIQHEIKGTIISASYIGNHGTKLLRGVDFNQVVVKQNGFLADFQRAQRNGYLARSASGSFLPAYNPGIAGSQPLTVFPTLTNGGTLGNATVLSNLQSGDVGTLAQFYQTNRLNGAVNFFPNQNYLGANYTTNGADSTFNSFQLDVRKRTSRGLTLQANYVFSKVLSNSVGDTQTNFEPLLDNDNPGLERQPAPFDLRQVVKANGIYELPLGPGHKINPKYLGRVLGGWSVGSVMTWQSGAPFSFLSARGTLNRAARSANNTADPLASGSTLYDNFKLRFGGNGVFFVPASAIGSDGRGVAPDGAAPFAGQLFAHPAAGSLGALQRRAFYGPNAFAQDISILKEVRLYEKHILSLRMDSQNAWNHPTFNVGEQNINSTTFGRLTGTLFGRRLVQFTMTYKF